MRKKIIILDIGCGRNKAVGSIGVDIFTLPGVDIVYDIKKVPHPLKEGVADRVICRHVLEHIRDMIPVMEEFHRILKLGGKLIINSPHGRTLRYLGDPTHERPITCSTMNYFLPDYPYNFYTKARFKINRIDLELITKVDKEILSHALYRLFWNRCVAYLWRKRVWEMEKILCFLGFNFSIEFELEKLF